MCVCLAVMAEAGATPLFEDDAAIDIELIGPIQDVVRNKEVRQEYPFVLRSDGTDLNVDVRVRGKSRVEVCSFPPLRLNFKRSETGEGPFAGQKKLKLVTHCLNSVKGGKNVLEEYLAYRIFGLLSEVSHRVRLLHIMYRDRDQRAEPGVGEQYGFLIEPMDQLAARVGGVPLEIPGVVLRKLDPDQAALVYVFQYMIGNTDWSLVTALNEQDCCHNGGLVELDTRIYYVPYDFDLSGIVNASYAKPPPGLRLRNVRQRRYRGFCMDQQTLRTAIQALNARRDAIYSLVRSTPGLSEEDAEDVVEYLAGYFDKAENEDKLLRSFERRCLDD